MKKKTEPKAPERLVDQYFESYENVYQQVTNKWLVYASIPVMLFGLIAFVWAIPFPHLQFLGRYNGFINWASFLIAILIYYYLRLSPVASYILLFLLFGFSYIIIQLEQWQKVGSTPLWLVGLVLLLLGLGAQFTLLSFVRGNNYLQLLLKAPLWFIINVIKKLKLRY
ncbi:hypothetical protein [Mucilaginibacter lacusdianchii]|uniref:hypothetical protein n=1 Tax=Mucilaginibacter lacusdianchii TaxID=2684211 RepID=UPI00131A6981|nr:hypothetical protein [Mucilaginibacter sp. JXJ CY 39]